MRVRRQKRERQLGVFAILSEIEVDASDEIPCGILSLEEILDGRFRLRKLQAKCGIQIGPQQLQHGSGQILRALHCRRCKYDCRKISARWRSYRWQPAAAVEVGKRPNGDYIAGG